MLGGVGGTTHAAVIFIVSILHIQEGGVHPCLISLGNTALILRGDIGAAGQVGAFAAGTGEHNHSCVAVLGIGGLHRIGVAVLGCFSGGEIGIVVVAGKAHGRTDRAGGLLVVVKSHQFRVHMEACALQAVDDADGVAGRTAGGAAAGIHGVDRVFTKHADVLDAGQGQNGIDVFQQDKAFCTNLAVQRRLRFKHTVEGGKLGVILANAGVVLRESGRGSRTHRQCSSQRPGHCGLHRPFLVHGAISPFYNSLPMQALR